MRKEYMDDFFALLRFEIKGDTLPTSFAIAEEERQCLLTMSARHSLEQLISDALRKISAADREKMSRDTLRGIVTVSRLCSDENIIMTTLEKAEIDHVLLKGSIMRELYPEKWMRSSCDVDVLVHESDIEKAAYELERNAGYKVIGNRKFHELNLSSPYGTHLELHFNINEGIGSMDRTLEKVWDNLVPVSGKKHEYRETNEFFIFHHFAHMAYHVLSGGCGIRPFLDVYIIDDKLSYDHSKVQEFLRECRLEAFASKVSELTNFRMNGCGEYESIRLLENYIVAGGSYGTAEQANAIDKLNHGGGLKHLMKRIFLSRQQLSYAYPWLKKYPVLLPVAQILRWLRLLSRNKRAQAKRELELTFSDSTEQSESIAKLLAELGLR